MPKTLLKSNWDSKEFLLHAKIFGILQVHVRRIMCRGRNKVERRHMSCIEHEHPIITLMNLRITVIIFKKVKIVLQAQGREFDPQHRWLKKKSKNEVCHLYTLIILYILCVTQETPLHSVWPRQAKLDTHATAHYVGKPWDTVGWVY